MRIALQILGLTTCFASLAVAQHNAGDPGWMDAADKDAEAQLAKAVASRDYKTVGELAAQLQAAQERKKKAADPLSQPSSPLGTDGIKTLRDRGFSLRQTQEVGEGKPAKFSYSKDYEKNTDGAFNAEFYLKWEPMPQMPVLPEPGTAPLYVPWYAPAFSAQGKLSTADSTTTDALRFRFENHFHLYGFTPPGSPDQPVGPKPFFDGLIAILSAKEESDRDFDVSRLSAELWLTFNKFNWHVGSFSEKESKDLPPVSWRWRPYIGLDAGGYLKGSPQLEDADSALRLMARGTLDVYLNFLKDWLQIKDVILYADNTYTYLTETEASMNYLKTGVNFQFNEFVGFGIEYKWGQDAPRFLDEEKLEAAFTLKF